MLTELEVATNVILIYLSKNQTVDNIYEICEIKNGNRFLLKQHIDALKEIFEKASLKLDEVLGGSDENESRNC